jgi:hypothetical protein
MDVHVKLPGNLNLDKYLCIKAQRTIRKDNVVAYNKRLYQLDENDSKKVCIEERIDGSFLMISKDTILNYKVITERPKQTVAKTDHRQYNRPAKPSKDHPWKKKWKNWYPHSQNEAYR